MIYKTRSITLKDGRGAILRAPRESDAEEMLEYLRIASGETDFLASYPEELKFTAEGERAYLKNNLDSPNTMMLGALSTASRSAAFSMTISRSGEVS